MLLQNHITTAKSSESDLSGIVFSPSKLCSIKEDIQTQQDKLNYRLEKRWWSFYRKDKANQNVNSAERFLFPFSKRQKAAKQELVAPVENNEKWQNISCDCHKWFGFWNSEDELNTLLSKLDLSSPVVANKISNILRCQMMEQNFSATEIAEIVQNIYKSAEHKLKQEFMTDDQIEYKALYRLSMFEENLMQSLHEPIFGKILEEESNGDWHLTKHMSNLSWLTPSHLTAKIDETDVRVLTLLDKAILSIAAINFKRSPAAKLDCILDCSYRIFDILKLQSDSEGGADDFLPILIYVLLQANPVQLHTNMRYILQFGNAEIVVKGERGYYFTHLCSVVSYIENINASSLNLSEEEFAMHFNFHSSQQHDQQSHCRRLSQSICDIYNKSAEENGLKHHNEQQTSHSDSYCSDLTDDSLSEEKKFYQKSKFQIFFMKIMTKIQQFFSSWFTVTISNGSTFYVDVNIS